jgi:hypothetical protein
MNQSTGSANQLLPVPQKFRVHKSDACGVLPVNGLIYDGAQIPSSIIKIFYYTWKNSYFCLPTRYVCSKLQVTLPSPT